MLYYALQVKTSGEEKYIKLFKARNPEINVPLYFPQRVLDVRRAGKLVRSNAPVFPGYIFIGLESEDDILNYHWAFRRTEGFFRFLYSNQNIAPLSGRDLELVLHFVKNAGTPAGKSRVFFDENSRIIVIDGPLLGLEGKIIKADKRKGRAKIKLDLYDESFSIDLAFEILDSPRPRI
ncbi:MAG: antiterminator LoaP [Treponema sp.]|jgi:transcriptional antiterminator NusG|nr:antiterminator LoaP [Treponema sp.]